MWIETILVALVPAIFAGTISYLVAVKKSKTEMKLLLKQNELDYDTCRKKAAQDFSINKEFDFFEKTDEICSSLIVAVQDTCDALTEEVFTDIEKNQKMARENSLIVLQHYIALKSISLLARPYLPEYVNASTLEVIHIYNENMREIGDYVKDLFAGVVLKRESKEWIKVKEFESAILYGLAGLESAKRRRVTDLLG